MTTKTRHCDECWHFDGTKAVEDLPPCEKGHKPRFYVPTFLTVRDGANWGWKRKCEDFKEAKHG